MPYRRLHPIPIPQFMRPAQPWEPEREVWLQLLGTHVVGGRPVFYLRLVEYRGTVTYFAVSVDAAWGFFEGSWRVNDAPAE